MSLLIAAAQGAGPAPALIDRVVAVVEEQTVDARIITASDLALERDLSARAPDPVLALCSRDGDPLTALIEQAVIRGLAGGVGIYQPSPAEVREHLQRIRAASLTPEDWQQWLQLHGLDEDRLAGLVYSRMVVERYIRRNLDLTVESATEEASIHRYEAWITGLLARTSVRTVDAR